MAEYMVGDGGVGDSGGGSGDDEEYETMTTGELLTKLEEVRKSEMLTTTIAILFLWCGGTPHPCKYSDFRLTVCLHFSGGFIL